MDIRKQNGRWVFQPEPNFLALPGSFALPCANVPRDLTQQEIQQSQNTKQQQYCQHALNPGNSVSDGVFGYLQAGFDPKDCIDPTSGRTLLMLSVVRRNRGSADSLIQAGAEINAKDKQGWTALNFAEAALARARRTETDRNNGITISLERMVQHLRNRGAVLGQPSTISAQPQSAIGTDSSMSLFMGEWKNPDAINPGYSRLVINGSPAEIIVQTWARCPKGECDQGQAKASQVGNNLKISLQMGRGPNNAPLAEVTRTLAIENDRLKLTVHTKLLDNSGRPDRTVVFLFNKQ